MSTAFEMLGISPNGIQRRAWTDPKKNQVAFESGQRVMELYRKGTTMSTVVTRNSLLNAIAGVIATGGSQPTPYFT